MKKINWNNLVLVLLFLINTLYLIAKDYESQESMISIIDTSVVWGEYQEILVSNSGQKLEEAFQLADSLLFAHNPDQSLYILDKIKSDSLYKNYTEKREIDFKIYDIYAYQWNFSKSIPKIKEIFQADSLRSDVGLMANSSLWVASTFTDNNDFDNALSWVKKSREYATKADSTRILAYLYMLEGDINLIQEDLYSAFELYKEAEKYTEQFPISNTTALIYLSLATCYSALEQYDGQISYNEKVIDIYNTLEDYSGVALALYNISTAYGNSGDYDKALQYALEGIEICNKEENNFAVSDMLSSLYSLVSQLYERKEEWDLSLKYLKLSDELVESNTSIETSIENTNQYIRYYTKLNDYDNALKFVLIGDSLKTTSLGSASEGDFLNARLEFYETFGFYDKALAYSRELISKIRKETSDEVADLVAEFEAQKNIDKINQEKQRLDLLNTQQNLTIANQKNTILFNISLLLLISGITVLTFQRYKSKDKLSKLLNIKVEERTKELKLSNENLLAEIEDHKSTTNQLLFAHRLTGVGEIASGLAHEIRNPLTNIIASMQILKSKHSLDNDEFADIIIRNAQNANVRIKELLNYSQPIDFKLEVISMHRVISEVINLVRGKLNKENIELKYSPASKLDLVSIDKKQINTVFLNFILNSIDAIKSTEKEGLIEISTYDEFNFVVIEFKDNGCGIEANIIPKIFQPFFTNKENGTGLGLNLAHKIIHQHGGIISAESKVGIYTTIKVKLLNIKS